MHLTAVEYRLIQDAFKLVYISQIERLIHMRFYLSLIYFVYSNFLFPILWKYPVSQNSNQLNEWATEYYSISIKSLNHEMKFNKIKVNELKTMKTISNYIISFETIKLN